MSDDREPDQAMKNAAAGLASRKATTGVYRTALKWSALLTGAVLVLGVLVGYFAKGSEGAWGALLGAGIGVLFCGSTILAFLLTIERPSTSALTIVVVAWVVKVAILVVVLVILRGMHFYDRGVLFVTIIIMVLGTLAIDALAISRGRITVHAPR